MIKSLIENNRDSIIKMIQKREKDNINYADIESIKKIVNKSKEEMKNEAQQYFNY